MIAFLDGGDTQTGPLCGDRYQKDGYFYGDCPPSGDTSPGVNLENSHA